MLVGIVAQRLVRKICQGCREEYKANSKEIELFTQILGRPPKRIMKGKGCPACQNLAFKGRLGIFEVMVMNATVRDMLRKKVNEDVFRKGLMEAGFVTLLKDGLDKVEQGLTTVEEVLSSSFRVF